MEKIISLAGKGWLDGVRAELATLGSAPSIPAIAALSGRLALHAMREDALRTLGDPAGVPGSADYRRHLVSAGDRDDASCLLIEWPAAHRTPLHDHAGLWGIELVLDGVLEVEEFSVGGDLDRPLLTHHRNLLLGVGDAAVFTARRYAHRCRNRSATRPALSLHVYGGLLDRYHAYHADPRGRFRASTSHARVDARLSV